MRISALATTILLGCTPVDPPEIGPEQTRCDADADCALWSAEYTYQGCCPTRCMDHSDRATAVNKATYYAIADKCYQHVVPACDRRDAKYACGERPRSAACVAGSCRVRELASP